MCAFNLRGGTFAHRVSSCGERAFIDASGIGVEGRYPKRLEQLLQLDKSRIGSIATRLCQYYARQMANRRPHPSLLCFALYEPPPLLPLRRLDTTDFYRHRLGTAPFSEDGVDLGEFTGLFFSSPLPVLGLTRNPRALSRPPLPLSVSPSICPFPSGVRPGYA